MKSFKLRLAQLVACLSLIIMSPIALQAQDQPKPTVAVLAIDSKTVQSLNAENITYLVRLELEKTGLYNVMDKYEIMEIAEKSNLTTNGCFAKSCLVDAGKTLGVSKMLTGSIEMLGSKLVITLRMIDVATASIEKTSVTEYLNLPELQKMIRISMQKLCGIIPDQTLVNQLIDYDVPVQSPKNAFRLNGPRMGFSYMMGDAAKIAAAPASKGGFDMYQLNFEFGWQQEIQYISAGSFQALIENIFLISGLESGRCIPNYAPLLGFRFGHATWEFAFGPTFRLTKTAEGFYDADGLIGPKNEWHLQKDWERNKPTTTFPVNYDIVTRLDSRGDATISTGLVIAVGRTFHSGYLNIPVNMYVAPRKDGVSSGVTFGFNIQKKDRHSRRDVYKQVNMVNGK